MRHDGRFASYVDIVARTRERVAALVLRHDLCSCTLDHALAFARAEAAAGLRATYFPLHTDAAFWNDRRFGDFVKELMALGHGIGLHHDALTTFVRTGKEPRETLLRALDQLRRHAEVTTAAAHGAPGCYGSDGRLLYANYEAFTSFDPARNVGGAMSWPFERVDLEDLGLVELYLQGEFTRYISDSGGAWRGWRGPPRPMPFERPGGGMEMGLGAIKDIGPMDRVQVLAHPCWWRLP